MKWTSLDTIAKGLLISKQYPIHFYMQFVYLGSRAYEELHFDSLQSIKTLKLPVNSYKAVPLPCDFMDWVQVGIPNGQFVRPLHSRPGISNLNNFDTDGTKINFGTQGNDSSLYDSLFFRGYQQYFAYEQFKGGFYGMGSGSDPYSFKLIEARNEIQLYEGLGASDIILQYISDGSEVDNATMITPYAKAAIEAYILWKMKEGSRAYNESERERAKQQWHREHALLRARKFGMSKHDIVSIVRRHTHGSIKG